MPPLVLGLAASHNGAACLYRGTELIAAIQEERLVRKKRAVLDPADFAALDYVLGGLDARAIDLVAVAPLRDQALAAARLALHPRLRDRPALFVPHHQAHAAAAVAQSGFASTTVLVVDGAGSEARDLPEAERALASCDGREIVSIYRAERGRLIPLHKQCAVAPTPTWELGDLRPRMMAASSLGVMYQAAAQQIFGQWDAAGKVMGLAPYGAPRRPVSDFLAIDDAGQLAFADLVYADHRTDERWPARAESYATLAAEVQRALEEALVQLARRARQLGGSDRLCVAGGVALNSVANTRIRQEAGFAEVFFMPAAEDSGTAIGAAVLGLRHLGVELPLAAINEDATGRAYSRADLDAAIAVVADRITVEEPADLWARAAELLDHGACLGWFQGRSELGPRALGQRSILLDPRIPDGKERLNARVKHREPFRPYAPAILAEAAADWFEPGPPSPFMLEVRRFRADRAALVPSVVHVDGTGRVQTVTHGPFRELIEAFATRTGVPLLLNTSFNVAGEPIVESPLDALHAFLSTELDALVLHELLIRRR